MTLARHEDSLERSGLAFIRRGFNGVALEPGATAKEATLWRIGRWWRARGALLPETLRVVDRRTFIVNYRIVAVDGDGEIRDLTTSRRPPSPLNALRSGQSL